MDTDEGRGDKDMMDSTSGPGGKLIHEELTRQIIGAAMTLHRTLGVGFLEKVYENALAQELRSRGLTVEQQKPITVRYRGQPVGEYFADILVEGAVVLELRTVEQVTQVHEAQTMNYLRATGIRVGLVLNFAAPRLEWKRLVA